MDLNVFGTSKLTNISHRSCKIIYMKLCVHILKHFTNNLASSGVFELDESTLVHDVLEEKEAEVQLAKPLFLVYLKRNGKVFVEVVKNCSKKSLLTIIQGKILEGSTGNTDGWRTYDGLILNGYTHHRVYHSHDEFARGKCYINGIESFWIFAKRRLSQFNGLSRSNILFTP